jgi:hypothetical protein
MSYKENPKTKGSGIVCCIPQTGECPRRCTDCFFQSGRSYLEPLDENLPNMPLGENTHGRVVRVNDGNDSAVDRELVVRATAGYRWRFFNTASPRDLEKFPGPVVLTLNPGKMTDEDWHVVEDPVPPNLMFVRYRANTWNKELRDGAVSHYTKREVPVVLTWMAYHDASSIPEGESNAYVERKRTLNPYWAIRTDSWQYEMEDYEENLFVSSCGKVEGERGSTRCRFCGVCLREFFATMERMRT